MSSWVKQMLPMFGFLIPMVAGLVSSMVLQGLKKANTMLDAAPAIIKQTANAVIALLVVVAANALGVAVSGDPATWGGAVPAETIQALVAALIAHVVHSGQKSDSRKPTYPFTLP